MKPVISGQKKQQAVDVICKRYQVERLELFGSALLEDGNAVDKLK